MRAVLSRREDAILIILPTAVLVILDRVAASRALEAFGVGVSLEASKLLVRSELLACGGDRGGFLDCG